MDVLIINSAKCTYTYSVKINNKNVVVRLKKKKIIIKCIAAGVKWTWKYKLKVEKMYRERKTLDKKYQSGQAA